MREVFLNSKQFSFIETGAIWHENPVFSLKKLAFEGHNDNFLNENQIFLGLTIEPLIFLENLKVGGTNLKPDLIIFASRHTSKPHDPHF